MKSPRAAIRSVASAFGLARAASDVETIQAAIADARTMVAEGEREEAAAAESYRESLLDEAGEPEAFLGRQQAAKIKRDRGEAMVSALTIRLGAVREAEARATRKAIHDDAVAKVDAIRARLPVEYRSHALAIRGLLRDLAEAEAAIGRAATEAPDFPAIPSPEAELRTLYGLPEEIVERAEVRLWVVDGRTDPVPAERQSDVRLYSDNREVGTLYLKGNAHESAPTGSVNLRCTLRTFTRTRYREAISDGPFGHGSLIRTVALPGFAFFDENFVTADPLRDYSGALIELASDLAPAKPLNRPVKEKLELVPDPPAIREEVVPFPKRELEPRRQPSATQIREANTPSRITSAERQRA